MLGSAGEVEVFEASRGRLEAIAYRLLGSAGDAEDVVQEAFLRWHAADRARIEVPEAWLTKVLTNLCLTLLGSARVRREAYVGEWLPEPVLDGDRMLGPADTAEQRESVSLAMLMLLERLTPKERVVYVLREAFGYPHREIAEMIGIGEANCQQVYRRARLHVADGHAARGAAVDEAAARRIAEEFLAAALSGETEPLVALLAADAVGVADGGGRMPARRSPIVGAGDIARYLYRLFLPSAAKRALVGEAPALFGAIVNGGPAVVAEAGGRVVGVMALEVGPGGVEALQIQVNPEKLGRFARAWQASGARRAHPLQGW
ncbi:RNA polymerase subunit sigma-70 [Mangrovactinospora gilvigrisea]|uniref:RNA polymerase subunit sigma-70 n=1 Tax=Mangrovactinospora gilvigrisea TaxID=1428644 RepID=A0A1J7BQB0_9ACTN|nr:RNA polymerase sigma factor SigJ [Mangrovactinospora gilvigrisea]OIV35633.1 RNA polymerase subunit sigma-70 [Mangrovactinospora gilvigrisea]